MPGNKLYFGDNLEVLRDHVDDASVDLIYLDPPFNSNANYNVLFKERSGTAAQSQAEAFRDTWMWGPIAEHAFDEVMLSNEPVSVVMQGLRNWLRESAMMAYLTMMAVRLIELRRVLKPTGSLYLHCDPVASHYLKILLDAVFGPARFLNEIAWKRANAHNFKTRMWPRQQDTILVYARGETFTLNPVYEPYGPEQLKRYRPDEDGRLYTGQDLTVSLVRRLRQFEWRGTKPPPHRSWGASEEQLEYWFEEGRILLKKDGRPRLDGLKVYLDKTKGKQIGSVWTDIDRISNTAAERLGYPTQKPVPLLERIISAGSKPGEVVLDPFCGCGTSVDAAEKLGRQWIGIDVTHYAITLIERRLKKNHPEAKFTVHGRPASLADAEALAARDPHQFQWWAAWYVGAQTYREDKRGPDRGIDGSATFANGPFGYGRIIISVKAGKNVGVDMVRQLQAVMEREKAEMGILITATTPTQPMVNEALGMGFVAKSAHGRLPRLQIVTAADLFAGRLPKLPPLPQALDGARPRRGVSRRVDSRQLSLMLAFNGSDTLKAGGAFVDPRYLTFGPPSEKRPEAPELPLASTAGEAAKRRPPATSHRARARELPLDEPLLVRPQPKRRRS